MKIRKAIRSFLSNVMQEGKETVEAARIIRKYSSGQELTEDEILKVREQMVDTLKLAGIAVPFAVIPGSTLLLPLMVSVGRKYGIDILPSSFSETIVYVRSGRGITGGDIVEFEDAKWIVEDVGAGVKLIGLEDPVNLESTRLVIPYLATRKLKEGDLCVLEDQPETSMTYDGKTAGLVKILKEIEKTEYGKIV
jgi:hypothetical protein